MMKVAVPPEHRLKIVAEIAGSVFKFSQPRPPVTVSGIPDVHRCWLALLDGGRGLTPHQTRSIGPPACSAHR